MIVRSVSEQREVLDVKLIGQTGKDTLIDRKQKGKCRLGFLCETGSSRGILDFRSTRVKYFKKLLQTHLFCIKFAIFKANRFCFQSTTIKKISIFVYLPGHVMGVFVTTFHGSV